MNITIFGGSFNPAHLGHLKIAKYLLKNKISDKVIFAPTGDNYNKIELINSKHRLQMLKLLIANENNMSITDFCINNNNNSTLNILEYFKSNFPNINFSFVLGSDNLKEIKQWFKYETLLTTFEIIVILRDNDTIQTFENLLREIPNNKLKFLDEKFFYNSSTQIRNKFKDYNFNFNSELPFETFKYILQNNLYTNIELSKLSQKIVDILSSKNQTISFMESCTGGKLCDSLTSISGSSEIFKFGAITYSNEFKQKLNVKKSLIDKFTVYSINVSQDMAKKISEFTNSTYGIGVTGKFNNQDNLNLKGELNTIHFSIYNKITNEFYNQTLNIEPLLRENSKIVIAKMIFSTFLYLLQNEKFDNLSLFH